MAIEVTSVHERRPARIITRTIKGIRRAFHRDARAAARRRRKIIFRALLAALVITPLALVSFLVYSYTSYSKIVDERLANGYLTSRAGIYAAPRTLRAGQSLTRDGLVAHLRRAGYIETDASDVWSGSFTAQDSGVEIRPRRLSANSFPAIVYVRFDRNNRIADLTGDGISLASYTLEPEVLTNDAAMKTGKRTALAYRDIPPVLVHAILSIEDHRFFEHRGVDFYGIARAFLRNVGDDEIGQGGSTITQQLVKNTYLSPEKTYRRKYAEAMIAFTLERRLSKEDIFALYCNEIYLGQRGSIGVRGVEQAAHVFFGKELKDLSLAEAATIAGMIQSPGRYAPDRHAEAAAARRNTVLDAMVRDGIITSEQSAAASRELLAIAPLEATDTSLAPYFIDYVNRVVETELKESGQRDERSLRINTTIDLELQQQAESAVQHQLERLDKIYSARGVTPQAALVALDPKTGNVLAMVGGRRYSESQLNRATDAQRQPGSVFKPIVYAAALESGLSPLNLYTDAPRDFVYDGRAHYRPSNYGGAYSMRDVTMRTGLVKSLNVVTVDVAMQTGLERVARTAEKFGLTRPQPYPALALGTTEVTPLNIAAAYTAFVNNGQRVEPRVIAHATDANGAEIIREQVDARQVVSPTTACMLTDMLADVVDHGTARAARGSVKRTVIAGKTGTSRDGWFVGYTPNLVCAVWIGFDDNKQLGLTGAEAALPAWTEFVKAAVELRPELGGEAFDQPAGITLVDIDPETGLLASASCPERERIAITFALAPNMVCSAHNAPLDLFAATDNSEAQATDVDRQTNNRIQIQSEAVINKQQTRAGTPVEKVEFPSAGPTSVETDTRGRATLTNEIRARPPSN